MPEPTFALTLDDDLPRTIRREREAREREGRRVSGRSARARLPSPSARRRSSRAGAGRHRGRFRRAVQQADVLFHQGGVRRRAGPDRADRHALAVRAGSAGFLPAAAQAQDPDLRPLGTALAHRHL